MRLAQSSGSVLLFLHTANKFNFPLKNLLFSNYIWLRLRSRAGPHWPLSKHTIGDPLVAIFFL